MDELFVYTDGGSRGNPGKSAIGIIILDNDGKILLEHGEFIGLGTNNQAEYRAIIKALELAQKFGAKKLNFFSDSELVVRQLNGQYKINNPDLIILWKKAKSLILKYGNIEFKNVRRNNEYISFADSLVNKALDEN